MDTHLPSVTRFFRCCWCFTETSPERGKILPCLHSICDTCERDLGGGKNYLKTYYHMSYNNILDNTILCFPCQYRYSRTVLKPHFFYQLFAIENPFPKRLLKKYKIGITQQFWVTIFRCIFCDRGITTTSACLYCGITMCRKCSYEHPGERPHQKHQIHTVTIVHHNGYKVSYNIDVMFLFTV